MKTSIILAITAITLGVGGDAWAARPMVQTAPAAASTSRFNWDYHLHKRYYPGARPQESSAPPIGLPLDSGHDCNDATCGQGYIPNLIEVISSAREI